MPTQSGPGRGSATRRRGHRAVAPVVFLTVLLCALEAASRAGVVDRDYFPPVTEVAAQVARLATQAASWGLVGQTLWQALAGLATAVCIAVPLGVLTGLSRVADDLTSYAVELVRPVPSVALIPLFILMLGTGHQLAIALAAFASVWPLFVQTRAGLRSVDPTALDTGRVYGLTPAGRIRWIVLPSAAPHIMTGVRLSTSLALILAVSAELIAGAPGVGRALALAQSAGDAVTMYAWVVVTGLMGLLTLRLLTTVESRGASVHSMSSGGGS